MAALTTSTTAGITPRAAHAPPAASFPAHPAAWYFFCHLDELRRGPVGRRHWTRDLVAFRTRSGQVAVLDARCAHLGADLACGEVIGETIQCPFHNWCFGADGVCRTIPAAPCIPPFARQQSFPVAIRHSGVFYFNGSEPTYPLPFFENEATDRFAAARAFSFTAHSSWLMVASQGFDTQHFESVHDRRLLRPPETRRVSPFALRTFYQAEIIGESLRDRVLRSVVGRTVTVTIHNWGGTTFAVKADFPRACSRFLVWFRPLEDGRTHCDVLVFAPRGLAALTLPGRRWFTRGHLVSEAAQVRGTEYRPARLIAADAGMIECFHWLAAIPQRAGATSPAACPVDIPHPGQSDSPSHPTL